MVAAKVEMFTSGECAETGGVWIEQCKGEAEQTVTTSTGGRLTIHTFPSPCRS